MSPTTADGGRQLSLVPRLIAALVLLGALTIVIGATGILVTGTLAWLLLVLVTFLCSGLLIPFLGDQTSLLAVLFSFSTELILVCGTILLPLLYVRPVAKQIGKFHTELGASGKLAEETHPELAATVQRLAQQADIQEPDLYVTDRYRPESYAFGGRSNGTIVVTKGLVSELSSAELTAVLAHEISHLVNGDSRLMGYALAPMLLAEQIGSDDPPSLRWILNSPLAYLLSLAAWASLRIVTTTQRLCSQLGIAILSREREFAADLGAAKLTGSPSTLASALNRLDETRQRPDTDKRTWGEAASALDILPRENDRASEGLFRTHPSTEKRIQRLAQLAVEMEQSN